MEIVTLSSKFQLVVPLAVRQRMQLQPGEKLQVISHLGRIELIPVRPARALRGLLAGMNPDIDREADRL